MGRGSRKESRCSERNCSATALVLGNACFSTARQWWFRVWHLADVNQRRSFATADLCYLKIWSHIFFCVHVCQRIIFSPLFFTWKWNCRLCFPVWKNKPCCLKHRDVIILWKILIMSGRAVAFLPALLFQVKVTFTQKWICSQRLEFDVFCVGKMQQHEAPIYQYDLDTQRTARCRSKPSFSINSFINSLMLGWWVI